MKTSAFFTEAPTTAVLCLYSWRMLILTPRLPFAPRLLVPATLVCVWGRYSPTVLSLKPQAECELAALPLRASLAARECRIPKGSRLAPPDQAAHC